MTHVIFYIDCKGVMDTISDPKANFFELGSIVSECRSLQLAKCNAYKLHNSLLA